MLLKIFNTILKVRTGQAALLALLMWSNPVNESFKHFAYLLNFLYILYTIVSVISIGNLHELTSKLLCILYTCFRVIFVVLFMIEERVFLWR